MREDTRNRHRICTEKRVAFPLRWDGHVQERGARSFWIEDFDSSHASLSSHPFQSSHDSKRRDLFKTHQILCTFGVEISWRTYRPPAGRVCHVLPLLSIVACQRLNGLKAEDWERGCNICRLKNFLPFPISSFRVMLCNFFDDLDSVLFCLALRLKQVHRMSEMKFSPWLDTLCVLPLCVSDRMTTINGYTHI